MGENPKLGPRQWFAAMTLVLLLAGAGCTPPGPRALLQGEKLIQRGDFAKAVEKLNKATELIPGEARAWNFLGMAYQGAGDYGNAMMAYQRAIKLDRDMDEAHYNLGLLLLEKNNPKSAADELKIYTALNPNAINGWLHLADAQYELEQYQDAENSYAHALQLKRQLPEAFNGLGLIEVRRKNYEKAFQYFAEALKYNPQYGAAQLNIAVVAHQHLDRKKVALRVYEEYLKLDPQPTNWMQVQEVARALRAEMYPEQQPPVQMAAITNAPSAPDTVASTSSRGPVHNAETTPAGREVDPVASDMESSTVAASPRQPTNTPTQEAATAVRQARPPERPTTNTASQAAARKETTKQRTNEVVSTALANRQANRASPPAETESSSKQTEPEVTEEPVEALVAQADTVEPPANAAPSQTVETGESRQSSPAETNTDRAETVASDTSLPPVEVATLEEETTVAVARDVEPDPAPDTRTDTSPPTANRNTPAPSQATAQRTEEEPEERGFFSRMNPARLFRRDDDNRNMVTPLPPQSGDSVTPLEPAQPDPPPSRKEVQANETRLSEAPPERPVEMARAETALPEVPPPVERVVRRYNYASAQAPPAGDREAAQRLFDKAQESKTQSNYVQASVFYAAAVEADPSWYSAHYHLGLISFQSGDWRRALSAFETALAINPDSANARYNFALTLQKAKYPRDAAEELEKLLEQNPQDVRAHLLLGNLYAQELNEVAKASTHYQQVLSLEPRHGQATAIRYWLAEHLR